MFRIAGLVLALLLVCTPHVLADHHVVNTSPGLWFTIVNNCDGAVDGFAVGDKLCLLDIGTATFMRAIFQGNLGAGAEVSGQACAGSDGNGVVLFVPPVSSGAQAVEMTVEPNGTAAVPSTFCGSSGEGDAMMQLKHMAGEKEMMKKEMKDKEMEGQGG